MRNVAYGLTALLTVAGAVVELLGGPVLLVFTLTALALVGLAWVLGQATESVGHYAGPRIGGILNATFGNAAELISQPDVDGALVGGASLDSADFAAIVEAAA